MTSSIPKNPLTHTQCQPFVRNKHVIELYRKSAEYKDEGRYKILHSWTCEIGKQNPNEININSLVSKISCVFQKHLSLKKRTYDSTSSSSYGNQMFKFPVKKLIACPKSQKRKLGSDDQESGTKFLKLVDRVRNMQKLKRQSKIKLKRKELAITKLKEKYNLTHKPTKINVGTQVDTQIFCDKGTQCNLFSTELSSVKNELLLLENENALLLEEKESNSLNTRSDDKGRPFISSVRQVCYDFVSKGVASDNIPLLIVSVLNNLANYNVSVNDLPSPSSISKMTNELTYLCRKQLSETLANSKDITMLRDGTTKKGKHFYGVKLQSDESLYTLGIKEVPQGTADSLMSATKTMLDDVAKVSNDPQMSSRIVSNITCTMSDRCATEMKINKMLIEMKKKSLPDVIFQYDSLPVGEQLLLENINEFKCAVHPLLQFATEAEKVLSKVEKEKGINLKFSGTKGETACHTFIRNVSKLFYKDGTGDPCMIRAYLLQKVKKIEILNFKGNRFNVLFYNAAAIYMVRAHIQTYLETTKQSLNMVQDMVLRALNMPMVMALCRVLGIINSSITLPYWKVSSMENVKAVEMAPVYKSLICYLEKWSKDVLPLVQGEESINENELTKPKEGDFSTLYLQTPEQSLVEDVLKEMCRVLAEKSKHLFSDFLNDQKFSLPNENIVQSSKSCPQNNITLERLMAQTDRAMTIAPNTNISSRESKIMFKDNKTDLWLENKSDKHQIIEEARKEKRNIQNEVKLRKIDLQKEYLNIIKQREIEKKSKEKKREHDKQKLIKSISESGYWMTEDEIDSYLRKCKNKTEQINALKQQINARKKILGQKVTEKKLFAFSEKGVKFTVDQLRLNLLALINLHLEQETENYQEINIGDIKKDPSCLIDIYIHHTWIDNNVEKIWKGKILSYISVQKMYKVVYWEDIEDEQEAVSYFLTVDEVITDILEGSLKFL